MSIWVLGAGAFGTALAMTLVREGRAVTLWGRDADGMARMADARTSDRLPGLTLPDALGLSADLEAVVGAQIVLLATPAQTLPALLGRLPDAARRVPLVACCKGIDLETLQGPSATIRALCPDAQPAILTGPSFAADIAVGLPTALTLACADRDTGARLQAQLSTATLRLYRSEDMIGAELGGALKNVIAIACGACMGAGLGDSARAALMTRGFAEMTRLAVSLGAEAATLTGLSGLGDLALTCTSDLSRNYRFGVTLGRGEPFDPAVTVEGRSTAEAAARLAHQRGIDLPITHAVADIAAGRTLVPDALRALLARPLKEE